MLTPLFFESIYKERVWGGVRLGASLGRKLPSDKRIGESWDVVDRPEAQSVVSRGAAKGSTLRQLMEQEAKTIMGPDFSPGSRFPILVKWLDCRERLSLQVHPPAKVAKHLGGEPKTENWYIAETDSGAHLIVGLRRGTTREIFEAAIEKQAVEECAHRFPVQKGQSILVRSGQIHAIDAGNLILEIQQNSDTTYRVDDWGRVGLDGKPRTLHVEESLASIDFDDIEPAPMAPSEGDALLAKCEEFAIRKFQMQPGRELTFSAGEEPRLLHVVSGRIQISGQDEPANAGPGDSSLLPFAGNFRVTGQEPGVLLMTSGFVSK